MFSNAFPHVSHLSTVNFRFWRFAFFIRFSFSSWDCCCCAFKLNFFIMENLDENDFIEVGNEYSGINNHLSLRESAEATARRRSSNRSIKRKKFDDELVEYSLGMPGLSYIKSGRTTGRTQSFSTELAPISTPSISIPAPIPVALAGPSTSTQPPPLVEMKPKTTQRSIPSSSKSKKKSTPKSHLTTKDLGRWKPVDDLALIIGIEQTNDIDIIHLGTKFSCKFTKEEISSRWYALLYDHAVSRVAVQAIRNLHPEMIAAVQSKALWSEEEEKILGTIKSNSNPTLETFTDLLTRHPVEFYRGRTPNSLYHHWQSLHMYYLLPDQIDQATAPGLQTMKFEEAEALIQDSDLQDPPDEAVQRELKLQQRRNLKEIRQLENEVGRWNVLVHTVTGHCPGEFEQQTLAVLSGRMVRFLMRSREVTIGRCGKTSKVDIDLALEGPANKVSRRQAILKLTDTGEFYLYSEGQRPVFVNGKPVEAGHKERLYHNTVVEFHTLKFIFLINQDLIRTIHT
ncbi:unnamed protein product [Ceutorhynchus assimilis]|uniref:FHA domain-containing protein n=1 Tax=Ceutorhynchus assimilis TaxID=467358 RepID=A0A9N9MIH8_9CUCU|nr:unnamed protein product [Ceutorhynchus assimilis]